MDEAIRIMRNFMIVVATISFVILISLGVNYVIDSSEKPLQAIPQEKAEGEIDLTWVSSTEYFLPKDHNGSSIIKLTDSKRNFVNTSCFVAILYPDRNVYMPEIEMNKDYAYGEYYQHWNVPDDKLGVYSQEVRCIVKNKNITNSKAFHVSNVTNILLQATNNISQSINTILDSINCSDSNYNATCKKLNDIQDSISSFSANTTISFISANSTLTEINNNIIQANDTLSDMSKIYYEIGTSDCYIGSEWIFTANVTNEESEQLPFLNCTLESTRFGIQQVPFSKQLNTRYLINNCTTPESEVNWTFNCVR